MLKNRIRKSTKPLILIISAALAPVMLQANTCREIIGQAFGIDNQRLLYTEKHHITHKNQHTVVYSLPNGKHIATKNLDYSTGLYQPSFSISNSLTAENLSVKSSDKMLTLKRTSQKSNKSKNLAVKSSLVIDAGFVNYLTGHWGKLQAGKTLQFHFLLLDHFKSYPLEAYKTDCEVEKLCVRITLQNAFLALFSSDIDLEFSADDKSLLRYRGRSNIALTGGNYPIVDIQYRYSFCNSE